MTTSEMRSYWLKSASEDVLTAESLFRAKRYSPCLFFCHLFIEKVAKALIVTKTHKPVPFGHKLTRLLKYTSLSFTSDQLKLLDDLT